MTAAFRAEAIGNMWTDYDSSAKGIGGMGGLLARAIENETARAGGADYADLRSGGCKGFLLWRNGMIAKFPLSSPPAKYSEIGYRA
jgi:hypothetical protein